MDDSRDMDGSAARVWAAAESGNDASGNDTTAVTKAAFTIGELSREFGVTLRALRFYENKGLISPQRDGLNRLYSQGDRTRLALILTAGALVWEFGGRPALRAVLPALFLVALCIPLPLDLDRWAIGFMARRRMTSAAPVNSTSTCVS